MAACGVCHSDLSATNGTIQYPLPLVLGHEGAGVIVAIGEGVDNYAVGDHVISSFVSMCGHCHYCQTGRPQLCVQSLKSLYTLPDGTVRTRDSAGQDLNVFCGCGVMAEVATVHMGNVVKIDQQMPLDRAALISCGVMTGVGAAVNTAKVEAGSIAVIFGCGGVGLNAIQGCAIAGAGMIVAVDTSDEKLEMAKQFGATHGYNVTGQANAGKDLYKLTRRRGGLRLRLRWRGQDFGNGLGGSAARRHGGHRRHLRTQGSDYIECAASGDQRKNPDGKLLRVGASAAGFPAVDRPVSQRPAEAR